MKRKRSNRPNLLHRFLLSDEVFGTSMSVLLHIAVILILAMFFSTVPPRGKDGITLIVGIEELDIPEEAPLVAIPDPEILPLKGDEVEQPPTPNMVVSVSEVEPERVEQDQTTAEADDTQGTADGTEQPFTPGAGEPVHGQNSLNRGSFASGGGLAGRTAGNRGYCTTIGETTRESEEAVEKALNWFAAHQCSDGGWNFDLSKNDSTSSGCGLCANGGDHGSRIAATSVVLLSYLGAGYSADPKTGGKHWKTVDRGLVFLLKQGRPLQTVPLPAVPPSAVPPPAQPALPFRATTSSATSVLPADSHLSKPSFAEARLETIAYLQGYQQMYSHGLATLAICEAHAMQPDIAVLKRHARGSVEYVLKAQDIDYSGGWRYTSKQTPGDMSVTGWQLMALKSASLAGLDVPKPTLYRVGDFLDLLEFDGGRRFDYIPKRTKTSTGKGEGPDSEKTCTAIGLLCRMYLGWEPGEPKLDAGMEQLQEWGPFSTTPSTHPVAGRAGADARVCNLYYAYYGTLAQHHYGGSGWRRWFPELRDHLVATQSRHGHENGSWHVPDHYCDTGGRLLNTALATMILEMPYRYLPLYRNQ